MIAAILLPFLGFFIQPGATQCVEEDLRLVGTLLEGRVEICSGGEWGTVCDDAWDETDARVVCRQLGFSDQGAQAFGGTYTIPNFGSGTGDVTLREVYCNGNESSLSQCRTVHVFCSHNEDSAVRCKYNGNAGLTFNGAFISNNSIVNLEDIDSTNGYINSLVCVSNQTACCNSNESNWYLPDGNVVTSASNLIQNKMFKQQVLLYRNGEEYTSNEIGLYRCEIKDSTNDTQIFYVGIYLEGMGKPVIVSLRFDRPSNTLICLSVGGPTMSVLWNKNGTSLGNFYRESQTIIDTALAVYENNLTLSSSSKNVSGLYSCSVSNTRGNSSAQLIVTVCDNGDAIFEPDSDEVTQVCYNNVYYDVVSTLNETGCRVENKNTTSFVTSPGSNEIGCRVENNNTTSVVILGTLVGLLLFTGVIAFVALGIIAKSRSCFSREYDTPLHIDQQYSIERLVNNSLYVGRDVNSESMQHNLAYTSSTIRTERPEETHENIYELSDTADGGYEFPQYETTEQNVDSV